MGDGTEISVDQLLEEADWLIKYRKEHPLSEEQKAAAAKAERDAATEARIEEHSRQEIKLQETVRALKARSYSDLEIRELVDQVLTEEP